MNKTKYEKQLKKAFIDWFEEKAEKIYNIGEDSQKYLSKSLGIKEEEFVDKYVKPITDLNNLQLIQFFKALSYNLADRFTPLPYVIKYQINQSMNPEPNALDWLLVHIKYIALFDFEDDISYECKIPYRQCIYCGALDKFQAPKYMVNTKYIEFNERKHFCHDEECKTLNGSNPEVHAPRCHYAIFARKKKTLIDRIKKSHSAQAVRRAKNPFQRTFRTTFRPCGFHAWGSHEKHRGTYRHQHLPNPKRGGPATSHGKTPPATQNNFQFSILHFQMPRSLPFR